MNLFDMERSLTKNKTNNKKLTESVNLHQALEDESERIKRNNLLAEEAHYEYRRQHANELGANMLNSRSARRKKLISEKAKFETALKEHLFMESIFDIFMESLLLDDDFKQLYQENLRELCESSVKPLMEEHNVTLKSLAESSSMHVKNIIALCEETAKKEADKNFNIKSINDKASTDDVILNEKDKKTKLSEEDMNEFNLQKRLETDDIADIVRDKVVRVVRKEQEVVEMDDMERQEIEDQTEDPAAVDARSEEEIANQRMADMQFMDDQMNDDFDMPVSENFILPVSRVKRPNKLQEESLFRSLQINIAGKTLHESGNLSEGQEIHLDMDKVLAESLCYYTLLETLHTARIIEFTAPTVRSMCKDLVYQASQNK